MTHLFKLIALTYALSLSLTVSAADDTNLALNKVATQSSTGTYSGITAIASKSVDGNTDGNFWNGSVSHTGHDTQYEWWHVDLGYIYNISKIEIYNRTDPCCKTRLRNVHVMLSDTPFTKDNTQDAVNNALALAVWKGQVGTEPGDKVDFDSINTTGRYVLIQKSNDNNDSSIINIAEVKVFGSEIEDPIDIAQKPLFVTAGSGVKPLVMLNLSNDHQLYFEAYPDYADLTGNGIAEKTYNHSVEYFGYFDKSMCYAYESNVFVPKSKTIDRYCNNEWSGNFLNWMSMSRIDVVRKILYGGFRSTDTSTTTILERSYLPSDAHSWVKYYNGDDLSKLVPFTNAQTPIATSTTTHSLTTTVFRDANNAKTFSVTPNTFNVLIGDQLRIEENNSPSNYMYGVVTNTASGTITVQVNGLGPEAQSGKQISNWNIVNPTREGISFCNTTWASSGDSQNITEPPKIRMAQGNYSLWTSNERWQCAWHQEKNRTGHVAMQIGGIRFSNGNDVSVSGLYANAENPFLNAGINQEFIARVEVCKNNLLDSEGCKEYGAGNSKPVGLLQRYGDDDAIHFGLLTGSYVKNKSGGMLRKNIGSFADEVNLDTGELIIPTSNDSIAGTLNRLRIYGYSHNSGDYRGDNCSPDIPFRNVNEGNCTNWGNPQAEIYLESLRYLAGLNPTNAFIGNDTNYITGLTHADWIDPLNSINYCATNNILQFNASTNSVDSDALSGLNDIWPGKTASTLTDIIGAGEGIHGKSYFIGSSGALTNRYCTSKTVNSLGNILGICPDGPNLGGSFNIAGLAHQAYTNSIRTIKDNEGEILSNEVFVQTYGVSLAPALPVIEIQIPNSSRSVTILPACDNKGSGTADNGRCALVDFKVIDQDETSGKFLVTWDIAEAGMDFDMDLTGVLTYQITDTNKITISTRMFAQSSSRAAGFGYIISGTDADGFHAHSGINGYNFTDVSAVSGCSNCRVDNQITTHTYGISNTVAESLQDPLLYAAKWGGFDKGRTNQFPSNPSTWDSKGRGIPDNYFFAINPAELNRSLSEVFSVISKQDSGSATSVASSTFFPSPSSLLFSSSYDSETWTGNVTAYKPEFATDGTLSITKAWDAASKLPTPSNRNIYSYSDTSASAIEFTWGSGGLTASQKALLNGEENILKYIRGESITGMRSRGNSVIGDIINSNPVFVHRQHFGYHRLGANVPEAKEYQEFVLKKRLRTPLIVVGANAGMLHGFDANTGTELFAYIPSNLISALSALSSEEYDRRYFVDGTPHVSDAYIDGNWKTILIGSLGAGGKSLFALDVTDPDNFTNDKVLWEFKSPELGYSFAEPTISRLKNGTWVVIVGNGYNSNSSTAKLLVIDLKSGELLKSIDTQVGGAEANGLSSAAILLGSENGNTFASKVYAGDLLGNLWKFDLNNLDETQFSIANNDQPFFKAESSQGVKQPITVRPSLKLHPQGGLMVMFGTGRYLTNSDPSDMSVQSVYGIRDLDTIVERSSLEQQTISFRGKFPGTSTDITVLSNNSVNYSLKSGWVLDLIYNNNPEGERLVTNTQLLNDRLRIATQISSSDLCSPGVNSWNLELDFLTGGRLSYSIFDLDGDGNIAAGDLYNGDPVSGRLNGGPAAVSTILGDDVFSGDLSDPSKTKGVMPLTPGRLSWREID